ncbi:MAG: efflux transporter periplasmic adaptor subunit, partial [Shewanella sp.]|nr:efflux transporter periplasmic adaptor subunit [Shewanella sp.]
MIQDTSGQDTEIQPNMGKKLKWPLVAGAAVLLVSGLVWSSVGG